MFAASKKGKIIHIVKQIPMNGNLIHSGYKMCYDRKSGQKGQKGYQDHRFVWECHNGLIAEGKVIDHINNVKDDNRLDNLQLLTQKESTKKYCKNVNHLHLKNPRKNKKAVKSIKQSTKEVLFFDSKYAAEKNLCLKWSNIYLVCNGLTKTSVSKQDGCSYKFEYVKKENLSDDYIKSANIKPKKMFDENRKNHQKAAMNIWGNKELFLPKMR